MTSNHEGQSAAPPRVSIVLPVYRRISLLPATLASVDRQTFTDYELIIFDDGSDPPLERWIGWLAPHARYLCAERNAGPAAARNAAAQQAGGQYLAFIDSDDIWSPETLDRHVQALDRNPDAVLTFVDTVRRGLHYATHKPLPASHNQQRDRLAVSNFIYTLSQVAVRKETFLAVGGFDEALRNCEDQKLYARCHSHGTLYHIGYPGVLKRLTAQNISRDLDVRFASVARYSRWAADRFAPDRSRASLYTASACMALKTMADTTSAAWWKHWAATTLRHPLTCLTHRGWYFAPAVKAYHFLCRRCLLFKRAELGGAPHRPDLFILHRTNAAGDTRLLEAFLEQAADRHPDILPAVVPLTRDRQRIRTYEDLGLGIWSAHWFRLRGYPDPPPPLLVVTEPDAPENPRADDLVQLARSRNAEVLQLPPETTNAHDLITAKHAMPAPSEPAPVKPAPVALLTLPARLARDHDVTYALADACVARRIEAVFIPTDAGPTDFAPADMALDAPPDLAAYAYLVRRATAVVSADVDQLLLARAAGRPALAIESDPPSQTGLNELRFSGAVVTPDRLAEQFPQFLADVLDDRRPAPDLGPDCTEQRTAALGALDELLQSILPPS